jgi:hypothetical protein
MARLGRLARHTGRGDAADGHHGRQAETCHPCPHEFELGRRSGRRNPGLVISSPMLWKTPDVLSGQRSIRPQLRRRLHRWRRQPRSGAGSTVDLAVVNVLTDRSAGEVLSTKHWSIHMSVAPVRSTLLAYSVPVKVAVPFDFETLPYGGRRPGPPPRTGRCWSSVERWFLAPGAFCMHR